MTKGKRARFNRRVRRRPKRALRRRRNQYSLINPFKSPLLLPRKVVTTCECEVTGVWDLSAPLNTKFLSMVVNANYPALPFAKFISGAGHGQLLTLSATSLTTATMSPQGFNTLVGTVGSNHYYSAFRVLAYKVWMNALPESTNDDLYMVMAPLTSSQGALPTAYTDMQQMQQANLSKGPMLVQYYNTTSHTLLSQYCTIAEVVGVRPQVVKDDDTYVGRVGVQPTQGVFHQCTIFTPANTNFTTASPPIIQIGIKYWLEIFDLQDSSLQ